MAPADSVSCLTQKARSGPRIESDEFITWLDGTSEASAGTAYVGLVLPVAGCGSFERVTCSIEKKNPTCGDQIDTWTGLVNRTATTWIQVGWTKLSTDPDVLMYYETGLNPSYSPVD